MTIMEYARHLAQDTGWNDETLLILLTQVIDENPAIHNEAKRKLDRVYEEEMGYSDDGPEE